MYLKTANMFSVATLTAALWIQPSGWLRILMCMVLVSTVLLLMRRFLAEPEFRGLTVFVAGVLLLNSVGIFYPRGMVSLLVEVTALISCLTLAFAWSKPRLSMASIVNLRPRNNSL